MMPLSPVKLCLVQSKSNLSAFTRVKILTNIFQSALSHIGTVSCWNRQLESNTYFHAKSFYGHSAFMPGPSTLKCKSTKYSIDQNFWSIRPQDWQKPCILSYLTCLSFCISHRIRLVNSSGYYLKEWPVHLAKWIPPLNKWLSGTWSSALTNWTK